MATISRPARAASSKPRNAAPAARSHTRAVATGDLVLLRFPRPADRHEFLSLRRRSRAFLTPWEATPTDDYDPFSPAKFAEFLRSSRLKRSRRFLICDRASGRIVGALGLGEIARGAFQSCYLGYWIGRPFARRGFGSEAVRLALAYAFDTLHLHRVEANIIPANAPSLALVRRLGFRHEGTARRYLRIAGRWQDHEHWAMTVEDWRTLAVVAALR